MYLLKSIFIIYNQLVKHLSIYSSLYTGKLLFLNCMTDNDPVAIIGIITTVLGVAVTYFATNARALRYLKIAQKVVEVGDAYFKGQADKTWTDLEYQELGKDMVSVIKEVQNDENIPVEMTSLEGKTV